MNLIKLTKNGQNVLVNVEHIDQIETLHTKGGVMSKVIFTNGNYCIVQETLEEIYEIVDGVSRGEKQIIDWTTTSIDDQLMDELGDALTGFDADEHISCIVITGSEKAFAAGADIGMMAKYSFTDVYKGDYITRNWETIRKIRKPVIAAVSGYALGGGCELAMMCDFIVAADTAKFGQPEVKLGILPGSGGTQRLPRVVGAAEGLKMMTSGNTVTAEQGKAVGLIDAS